MQSHQQPATLHKTLFLADWVFFFLLSLSLFLLSLNMRNSYFLVFSLSFPNMLWASYTEISTALFHEQRSNHKEVSSKSSGALVQPFQVKKKSHPYKWTCKAVTSAIFCLSGFFFLFFFLTFLPQWSVWSCLKWGLPIQQWRKEQQKVINKHYIIRRDVRVAWMCMVYCYAVVPPSKGCLLLRRRNGVRIVPSSFLRILCWLGRGGEDIKRRAERKSK